MQQTHSRDTEGHAAGTEGQLVEALRARAGAYRFFGRAIESEIDSELLRLIRGAWRETLCEMGFDFGEPFHQASEPALLEQLAEEYTTLIMAPGGSSPFASVFETGRMFQRQADRAADAYREAGLCFQSRLSGEFPDHIGVMLSFLASQLETEAAALEQGDAATAAAARERWQRFLIDQVAPWGPAWARRTAAATEHPFYAQICAALEQWLWQELAELLGRDELKTLARLNQRDQPKLDYDADFRKASGL